MRWTDILKMSLGNLRKRKLRSILTIIGVVIGITAIVGFKAMSVCDMHNPKALLAVNVSPDWAERPDEEKKRLNDETIEAIEQIEGVDYVIPILAVPVTLRVGQYTADVIVRGMPLRTLREGDLDFAEGSLPEEGDTLKFIYGCYVQDNFIPLSVAEGGDWYEFDPSEIDFMRDPVFVSFQENASEGDEEKPKRKYIMPTAAVQQEPEDGLSYNEDFSAYDIYADIEALKWQLHQVYKGKAWPNQEASPSGMPLGPPEYSELKVRTVSIDYTKQIQKQLNEAGFNTYSSIEFIDSMRRQSAISQAVLGGIGGISLLVAAIGIANTMMMSIYERTKEIGIMKVLGCSLGNIRAMFLTEAALIGLIGGVLGLLQSYGLSFIINKIAAGMMSGEDIAIRVSLIPPWLSIAAVLFAALVGMVSGMVPAVRAMRLSPLEAIRAQ